MAIVGEFPWSWFLEERSQVLREKRRKRDEGPRDRKVREMRKLLEIA